MEFITSYLLLQRRLREPQIKFYRTPPNICMDANRGVNRPPKGILALRMAAIPKVDPNPAPDDSCGAIDALN